MFAVPLDLQRLSFGGYGNPNAVFIVQAVCSFISHDASLAHPDKSVSVRALVRACRLLLFL